MPDNTGQAPSQFYRRALQLGRVENAGMADVFYPVETWDGQASALQISKTGARVNGSGVLTEQTGVNYVSAPASDEDFSMLPEGVAPTSGLWIAVDGNRLWTIAAGEMRWRLSDRALV